jgi:hypothetical protein
VASMPDKIQEGADLLFVKPNLGRCKTSLYSDKISASIQSVTLLEETIRTISPHGPKGDKRPATRTLVSRTIFIGRASCEQL